MNFHFFKIVSKYNNNTASSNKQNKKSQINQENILEKQLYTQKFHQISSNNYNNVDDLCEIIEKIQGTRLESQRCELSQDLSSVSWLFHINY